MFCLIADAKLRQGEKGELSCVQVWVCMEQFRHKKTNNVDLISKLSGLSVKEVQEL